MKYTSIQEKENSQNGIIPNFTYDIIIDVSRSFMGIQFSAGDFRVGARKNIIVNFEG